MSTLTADVPGTYEVDLIVSDGLLDSEPARVTVVATTAEGELVHALEYAVDLVNGLDPAVFKNRSLQKNMAKHIGQALGQIDKGEYDDAREKLEAVARQTDGCANDSEPDRNDWIQQCDAQDQIHPVLVHALGLMDEILGG
jgi:phage gp29-like protein